MVYKIKLVNKMYWLPLLTSKTSPDAHDKMFVFERDERNLPFIEHK